MKNLVLSTLIAAAATSSTGCFFESDDGGGNVGTIAFTWALKSTDAGGNTIPAGCPAGGDSATLFALREGAPISSAFSDTYDCVDGRGTMSDLEPGTYTVWVRLGTGLGESRVAESGSQVVQVFDGNSTPATYDIYVDRAFFLVGWDITGRVSSCATATGEDGVAITATDGGGGLFDVTVDCEEGEGRQTISEPIPSSLTGAARYVVTLSLLNAQQQSIGDSQPQPNKSLDYGNELEDLGILPINVR